MIEVFIEKNDNGNIRKIIVQGHASYAYEANEFDVVCAGVSVLTISLLNGFEEVLGINESDLEREVDAGFTSFQIPQFEDELLNLQVKTLTDVYVLNIRNLASAYSDYITVIEKSSKNQNNRGN